MTTRSEQWTVRGRTVLITGATGGIGLQTARVLAGWGAQLLLTGRDEARGQQAAAAIRRESGQRQVSRGWPKPLPA